MNKHLLISVFLLSMLTGILYVEVNEGGLCNPLADGHKSHILNNNLHTTDNLIEIVKTEPHFLILRFRLPKLVIQTLQENAQKAISLHFNGAYWTSEFGKPKLPIYSVQLGLPSSSSVTTTVLQKQSSFKKIDLPLITNQATDPFFPDAHDREDITSESSTSTLYPADLVEVIPVGYVRSQRIGVLHICPIQYNHTTKQIKITDDITFRIDFFGASTKVPSPITSNTLESPAFEDLFKSILINNTQAYPWRHRSDRMHPSSIQRAPAADDETRRRFKIRIPRSDMYRISYNNLKAAGITPEEVNLDSILIDLDSTPVVENSRKQGYYIFDHNQNGTLNQGDMIVFYARGLSNKFTDTNIYWFSFTEKGVATQDFGDTLRIGTRSVEPISDGINPPSAFRTKIRFEENIHYDALDGDDITSELADHYFWTGLRGDSSDISKKPFRVEFPNAVPRFDIDRNAILRVRLQGSYRKSAALHKAAIHFNDNQLGNVAEWRRQDAPVVTRLIPQNKIHHNFQNELVIQALDTNNTPIGSFDFYLDWYEFEYWRDFYANSNRLEFSSNTDPVVEGKTYFKIVNFSSDVIDLYSLSHSSGITAKLTNGKVTPNFNTYQLLCEDDVIGRNSYFAIANNAYSTIGTLVEVSPSTLKNPTTQADYIVISHKSFLESIKPLVAFRRAQGLIVKVVDIDEIYNEFSSGLFSPFAIRHFLRYAYHTWQPPAPTYVLLVGDAHYDYKRVTVEHNRTFNLYPNFVPTYHSWAPESGETAIDQRFVNVSGDDALPDMFIGRLSVQTKDQLDTMVKKIIDYEQNPKIGQWQGTLVQVADDESDNPSDDIFEKTRNKLIKDIIPIAYNTKQIYLRQIRQPDLTHRAILDAFDAGALVIEYAGHGGNQTWADEGIFRITDAEKLRNDNLPFVITTTCLNGEFDKPQEFERYCLSEQLLHGKYGAIASLSATRLTYAQANADFDTDLFTAMFVRQPFEAEQGVGEIGATPPSIGKIVNDAKIRYISRVGNRRFIPGTEQYALLGDPATPLALPTLDIKVNLEGFALNSDRQIVALNDEVGTYDTNGTWWKADRFSTENFVVSAVFQNNFDSLYGNELTRRTLRKIWQGEYGTIRMDIPPRAVPGRGVVQMFAHDGKRAAIGGELFWVDTPIIGDVRDELDAIETHTLNIQALIYDDQGGNKGIQSIVVQWIHTSDYKNVLTPMVKIQPPHGTGEIQPGGQWYGIQTPIPLPQVGRQIRYRIIVTDTSGLEIAYPSKTERIRVDVPKGPDISIEADGSSIAPIRYVYDEQIDKYILIAELINNGGRTVKADVDVVFTEGNPDLDSNLVIDEDAVVLGKITLQPDDWQEGDTVLQHAIVKLKLDTSLSTGVHKIYVTVDPEVDTEDGDVKGNIVESDDYNNTLYITIVVNEFFYVPSESLSAFSLDRVFDFELPTEAAVIDGERVPLTISSSNPFGITQPSLEYATIPRVAALRRGLLRTGDEYAQQYEVSFRTTNVTLKKPATLKLRFDSISLEDIVRETTPWQEGSKDYRAALIDEAEKLSIYAWQPTYEKWKRLPSQVSYYNGNDKPQADEEGPIFQLENYITPIQTDNANIQPLPIESIKIDSRKTPAGIWVILFLDPTQYVVYLKRKHHVIYHKFETLGELDLPFREENYGLEFTIPENWVVPPELNDGTPIVPFEFGDILIFETDYNEGLSFLKDTRNQNVGNGTATIIIRPGPNNEFAIGDWFIFFTSNQSYEIRDKTGAQVNLPSNAPLEGKVNQSLYSKHLGFEILVTSSSEPFQFGDKIKFSTAEVATITAETTELTPFTLLSSDDVIPPTFNLWVDGVQPQSGSVISPRPHISMLLEDTDGVNLDTLIIRRGDNGKPLEPISDYKLRNPNNVNTVPIDYEPILFPGEYAFEIEASDFNGNAIGGKLGKIQTRFVVIEMPDITSPVIEILVNDEVLIGEESDTNSSGTSVDFDKNRITEQPHCEIRVTDETALDNSLLKITFNKVTADSDISDSTRRYQEFDEAKWDFDEKNPVSANFSFSPDLPNGTYQLQVTASDTSENTTELETIFTLDEAVNLSDVFNVPNPVEDGKTFFTYKLVQPSDKVTIKIYTVSGRLIKTISNASAERGDNETYWDGRDEIGIRCANGVYLYRVIAQTQNGSVEKIGKLAILR